MKVPFKITFFIYYLSIFQIATKVLLALITAIIIQRVVIQLHHLLVIVLFDTLEMG